MDEEDAFRSAWPDKIHPGIYRKLADIIIKGLPLKLEDWWDYSICEMSSVYFLKEEKKKAL